MSYRLMERDDHFAVFGAFPDYTKDPASAHQPGSFRPRFYINPIPMFAGSEYQRFRFSCDKMRDSMPWISKNQVEQLTDVGEIDYEKYVRLRNLVCQSCKYRLVSHMSLLCAAKNKYERREKED